MHRTALALLFLSVGACHLRPPNPPPEQDPGAWVVVRTRNDVDRYAGRVVVLEGTFDHMNGTHGVLTLDSGVRLVIPNFYRHPGVRGIPWTEWVGWRFNAAGMLHSTTPDVPGYDGPAFYVGDRFSVRP